MIDSHNHIDSEVYQKDGGVGQILASAKAKGVSRIVAPATHLESFGRLQELSGQHPEIFPAAGVHPHDATLERCENLTSKLDRALEESSHPILGETGLEGHYDFVPEEVQLQSLRLHLEVAKAHGVPIILHCRKMEALLFEELERAKLPAGGVVHCFTGNWEWAQRFLELGFHIGITGIVTFKKSLEVQEVAKKVPADRLLVETDGPYLAPIPFRGKTNKPEFIPLILEKIAELRSSTLEQMASQTVTNTETLFRLPPE